MLPFIVRAYLVCVAHKNGNIKHEKKIKGCRVSNSRPTYMPISSKPVHCCVHVSRVFFFWLGCCPLLYVRTSYVSRDPVSYIVSAYLVSYCLLVQQQQRFHRPTLKPTPTCPSAASGVHCCIHVTRVFFFFNWDVALYCTCVPGMCRTQR